MGNNATSDFSHNRVTRKPDNPQETLDIRNYYYSGFFAGEMTCSVIKATNYHPRGYYYMVDFTVSNADRRLLNVINQNVFFGLGNISPIKRAFNLKLRGKEKVRTVLRFLERYPILAGDLAQNRIVLLKRALDYLDQHRGQNAHKVKTSVMDSLRESLRRLKTKGIVERVYDFEVSMSRDAVGYFLAGVLDAEGSFGFKNNGSNRQEPFIVVAMKDRKIIELMRDFMHYGSVRLRKDGAFHFEINSKDTLKIVCHLFLERYPLQHRRQRQRLANLQRILNDYTPSPRVIGVKI